MPQFRLRPGEPSDAPHIARLINIAGDGIPLIFWRESAGETEDPLAFGAARSEVAGDPFSYENAVMGEADGEVCGMAMGHAQPSEFTARDLDEVPALARPLILLEWEAPGSFYLNALAVYEGWQGRGLGAALLADVDRRAADAGVPRISLIVASENEGAAALYQRNGFKEHVRRPVEPHPDFHMAGDWVLMIKTL